MEAFSKELNAVGDLLRDDYNLIAQTVRGYSGLDLGDDKDYLIKSRLEPILTQHGFKNLTELCQGLRATSRNQQLVRAISEALATHESLFFRDILPFQYLVSELVPSLTKKQRPTKNVRIWSAACSFGQEPYSILMSIDTNSAILNGYSVEILATDFSSHALARASEGKYSKFETQRGLNPQQIEKFFDADPSGNYQIKQHIKSRVKFKELNFIDSFNELGTFDIIFSRNVLIYFNNTMKKQILDRMASILAPDGYLILGNTESVLGITDSFKRLESTNCSIFVKTK